MSGSFNWSKKNLDLPAPAGLRSSPNKEEIFPPAPAHQNTMMDFSKDEN